MNSRRVRSSGKVNKSFPEFPTRAPVFLFFFPGKFFSREKTPYSGGKDQRFRRTSGDSEPVPEALTSEHRTTPDYSTRPDSEFPAGTRIPDSGSRPLGRLCFVVAAPFPGYSVQLFDSCPPSTPSVT
jgi:hypothetical protein